MDNIYQKGQIYTIRSHQTDIFYIGSTTQALHQRLSGHRRDFKNWSDNNENRDFITSFEILKYEDHYIELLEIFACNSKKELNKREGMHIRSQEKCVNKQIAGRTRHEYRAENREQLNEQSKQYYAEHQEQLNKKSKKYNAEHREQLNEKNACECGGKYTIANKTRHFKTKIHQTYLENNKSII